MRTILSSAGQALGINNESQVSNDSRVSIDGDLSEVANVLSVDRRCNVIRLLHRSNEATSINLLADTIAEIEHNGNESVTKIRKRIYVGLYQTHLKKLEEAGVLEYDKRSGNVYPGPELDGYANALCCLEEVVG